MNQQSPHGAWEYALIPQSERKPIRVWRELSENDNGSKRNEASLHNWVMANQRLAAELKAKGYAYRYVFAEAAGHTDGRVTRQSLPGALESLWLGYPVKCVEDSCTRNSMTGLVRPLAPTPGLRLGE